MLNTVLGLCNFSLLLNSLLFLEDATEDAILDYANLCIVCIGNGMSLCTCDALKLLSDHSGSHLLAST